MPCLSKKEDVIEYISLADFTHHKEQYMSLIQGVFSQMIQYDVYDLRREQITYLCNTLGLGEYEKGICFDAYYTKGDQGLIQRYIDQLSDLEKEVFISLIPYRKRAFGEWELMLIDGQWHVLALPLRPFTQDEVGYRALPRVFPSLGEVFMHDVLVQDVLVQMLTRVQAKHPGMKAVVIECHAMRLCADAKERTNTPEGIHQDGVDYIMNFIIAREHVHGGISRVFQKQEDGSFEKIEEVTLGVGEGLFISDKGSTVYHDATPVKIADDTKLFGYRDLLGFDFRIVG